MTTYYYDVSNTSNITTKVTQLTTRVNDSLEIITTLSDIVYNSGTNQLEITFIIALSEFETLILDNLVQIIVEEVPVKDIYPEPRTIISTRYSTPFCDDLNGYTLGCVLINTIDETAYICVNNTTEYALWKIITDSSMAVAKIKAPLNNGAMEYFKSYENIVSVLTNNVFTSSTKIIYRGNFYYAADPFLFAVGVTNPNLSSTTVTARIRRMDTLDTVATVTQTIAANTTDILTTTDFTNMPNNMVILEISYSATGLLPSLFIQVFSAYIQLA